MNKRAITFSFSVNSLPVAVLVLRGVRGIIGAYNIQTPFFSNEQMPYYSA